jgi:hypothetical protein
LRIRRSLSILGEAMRAATTNVTKNFATVAAKKPAR